MQKELTFVMALILLSTSYALARRPEPEPDFSDQVFPRKDMPYNTEGQRPEIERMPMYEVVLSARRHLQDVCDKYDRKRTSAFCKAAFTDNMRTNCANTLSPAVILGTKKEIRDAGLPFIKHECSGAIWRLGEESVQARSYVQRGIKTVGYLCLWDYLEEHGYQKFAKWPAPIDKLKEYMDKRLPKLWVRAAGHMSQECRSANQEYEKEIAENKLKIDPDEGKMMDKLRYLEQHYEDYFGCELTSPRVRTYWKSYNTQIDDYKKSLEAVHKKKAEEYQKMMAAKIKAAQERDAPRLRKMFHCRKCTPAQLWDIKATTDDMCQQVWKKWAAQKSLREAQHYGKLHGVVDLRELAEYSDDIRGADMAIREAQADLRKAIGKGFPESRCRRYELEPFNGGIE